LEVQCRLKVWSVVCGAREFVFRVSSGSERWGVERYSTFPLYFQAFSKGWCRLPCESTEPFHFSSIVYLMYEHVNSLLS